ncbi:CDP-alcohol phosphatidyltransferase [Salinihabitans flavidus]|uniref:CDP-alcohol phosphatidyltransferase n=1 Tax=Salinihabitans flavidus TaxID=569882 RepID=A0A1H8SKU2_9RHOB|nr:CDP-alcohol phosphatidyltransferase family protein [Salinihabitans flavidus]SEO79302.1 CDP-alcohol phosphatidyltransferase [Salinihabitans flavidus]
MTASDSLSFRAVLASFDAEQRRREWATDWSIVLLYRAPGLVLAWLFLRLGLLPTTVTLIGLGLSLALPLTAGVLPLSIAGIAVFALALAFQITDCADGTMARASGQISATGGRADFLVDMAHWGLLYVSLGLLADRTFGTAGLWSALGATAGWMRLYARTCNDAAAERPDDGSPKPPNPLIGFIAGLYGLIPFTALAPNLLHIWVIGLVIYSALDIADALFNAFR